MTTDSLALDFKSATLYAIRVVLHSASTAELTQALAKRMADAGSFFENEPVVLDASRVDGPIDWPALVQTLHTHNLPTIGVVAQGANLDAARAAGLVPVELSTTTRTPSADAIPSSATGSPLSAIADPSSIAAAPSDTTAIRNASQTQTTSATQSATTPPAPTALVINKPLRSGQRIYARHTDLVVIGMVSQGAEVIADGNIHVYGPLRGKAMAGARGDTSARIFTTQLDAELLAIAGVYRVVEDKLDSTLHNQPALVRLHNDSLHIETLN